MFKKIKTQILICASIAWTHKIFKSCVLYYFLKKRPLLQKVSFCMATKNLLKIFLTQQYISNQFWQQKDDNFVIYCILKSSNKDVWYNCFSFFPILSDLWRNEFPTRGFGWELFIKTQYSFVSNVIRRYVGTLLGTIIRYFDNTKYRLVILLNNIHII